jgi:hypothetical protein
LVVHKTGHALGGRFRKPFGGHVDFMLVIKQTGGEVPCPTFGPAHVWVKPRNNQRDSHLVPSIELSGTIGSRFARAPAH